MKIVFIASHGHSGSTLLDLLISSHEQVVSVGEVRHLSKRPDRSCTCGAPSAWVCPFWSQVGEVFASSTGKTLREVDLNSDDNEAFLATNRALFRAVSAVTGCDVIVDSSKNPPRLNRLLETDAVDLYPIHLIRPPQGVVYSRIKKQDDWLDRALRYPRRLEKIRRALRDHDHRVVRYNDLVTQTPAVLTEIMNWIGLSFDPDQLRWAGRERHNIAGNGMRFGTDSTIRLDTEWIQALSGFQKLTIEVLARVGYRRGLRRLLRPVVRLRRQVGEPA